MTALERWDAVAAEARARNVEPIELERLVISPLSKGGAGWPFWKPNQTTEALAGWLRRRLDDLAKHPSPAGAPVVSSRCGAGNSGRGGDSLTKGETAMPAPTGPCLSRTSSAGKSPPDRIVIYGPPGWGKTSFAARMPKAIFLMTPGEDRLMKLIEQRLVPPTGYFEDIARSWSEVTGAVSQLLNEPHDYQTLVIDTGNGAEQLGWADVCASEFGGDWGEGGFNRFGTGEKVTGNRLWAPFLASLDQLREERRMRVVLCCHAGVRTVRNPEGADYEKIEPALSKTAWALTAKWADMILCGSFVIQVKKESKLAKGKATGGGQRLVHTQPSAAYEAKNCHRLPATIDLGSDPLKAFDRFRAAFPQRAPQSPAPSPAPQANGQAPAPAPAAPRDAAALQQHFEDLDKALEAEGLIQAGELLVAVHKAVTSQGIAGALGKVPPLQVAAVWEIGNRAAEDIRAGAKRPEPAGEAAA